jgi:hypothetical protein
MPKAALIPLIPTEKLNAALPNLQRPPSDNAYMAFTDRKMISLRAVAFRDLIFIKWQQELRTYGKRC